MHRCITLLAVLLCSATLVAQQKPDTAFQKLYQQYYQLYGTPDKEKEFFAASEQMQSYYLKNGKKLSYYKILQNEVLYDTENGHTYRALKRTYEIMDQMKKENFGHYDLVYTALGTIYESRGNYRMANYYYMDALKNVTSSDTISLISIYSRIASLKTAREPEEAWKYNEKFGALTTHFPEYYKVYLALKGEIAFYQNREAVFHSVDKEFLDYLKSHPTLDNYGVSTMETIRKAYAGDYEGAIALIEREDPERKKLHELDLIGKIYEMMGRYDLSLRVSARRRDLRDSLNSDMMFNNLNEVNAEMGIIQLTEKASLEREAMLQNAARERERWLAAVICLLLGIQGLIVWRYFTRRRYQRKLLKQNRELEIALDHAKESDRMKTAFIEHVSHEIRTPLNVITGFAQIVTNPDYQLDHEERNVMLTDISRNTVKITDIVNELLEVAQDESKEYYEKNDDVNINELCQHIVNGFEQVNNGKLTLTFRSTLNRDFVLRSNQKVLTKILQQLMSNALKFTEHGSVELRVRERAANGGVEFCVTDTGIGIDEQYHDKVFERFFKVDSFKQGLGLGLTMSRKMAELLGGTLTIDKAYKKGARFVLVLPV